ncbi:MAG: DUF2860 family protein [Aeromonas popoffii]|uniref:DUF2860 family protein n=1 Tax=Aeromonas popoffii TaxID=70856 RepID=UPI0005A9D6F7|nr:DUF2860 family protein [Aeromonas popoffii]
MKKLSFIAVALLATTSVNAEIIKIPTQSGFSGFVIGGVGTLEYKSNMYKGPNDDNDRHAGLFNSPESHSSVTPIFGADLRYTFAETRTQLFLGNLIQDAVRFDFTQQLGVRQQMGDKGIVALAYVFPLLPADTWSDPYAEGNRHETDMKSGGGRLAWDQIWGTHFNTSFTMRKFDISEERSGQSLGLSSAQRDMLDRNGTTSDVALSYDWIFTPGHVLRPELVYSKGSFDGSAMSYDKTQILLSHGYNNSQWSLVSNIYLGQMSYDEVNPIFGDKADSDEFGISASFFWHRLFDVKGLNGLISASYRKSDSDINFYDASIRSINTGLVYHF